MLNIIGAVVSGLVIGVLARYFYPGAVTMGLGMTMLLGIAGSLLAGLITTRGRSGEGLNRAGCLASILGAMALIFLGRMMGWHL
ncbi:putative membrane protein YeaQ/YmgE (transglycosylase-associated protein family) [Novosphingobium kunmingense]|uniref:Putative membrane protein YeaQ/YmgE (Transglycosylase-associated protein family) n=1 Tax=Novosphingobium kunmingense TaxID=1211806 RepID=A0A2N0HJY7_9SPHN|nr:GlsB/YeaQ/YmgE family stress response membrane protein [Novosphingobium kunmingense]PKB19195.1 putative membrane protein YeaQ/YmgE (transglycosylase-associated protein family) [Novosphingobium kunmingense]